MADQMRLTGKTMKIPFRGRDITYYYQACNAWTHPYPYLEQGSETLSTSGCGIFALCHAMEWIGGNHPPPAELADFSLRHGGRGDDGTDRPSLLSAMMQTGLAGQWGFAYREDGLLNGTDALFDHLYTGKGVALCNLRAGHIVALLEARVIDGQKQVLVIDSVAESAHDSIRDRVCEVIPQSETIRANMNKQGITVSVSHQYAMFYTEACLPFDYNLMYTLR